MQTEPSSLKQPVEQHYDWKKAMAHNARVLSSQEKAMDEYLKRQRASAEQHINQMQSGDQVVHLGGNEAMISLQVRQSFFIPSFHQVFFIVGIPSCSSQLFNFFHNNNGLSLQVYISFHP